MTLERLASSSGLVPVGRATARGERVRRARAKEEAKEGMIIDERRVGVVELKDDRKEKKATVSYQR